MQDVRGYKIFFLLSKSSDLLLEMSSGLGVQNLESVPLIRHIYGGLLQLQAAKAGKKMNLGQ